MSKLEFNNQIGPNDTKLTCKETKFLISDAVKMHQNMQYPHVSIIHSRVYFHILKKVTQDECFHI